MAEKGLKKRVLLIDDEQGFLEALADALIYEGAEVLTARTGEEGLAILADGGVDLVTIDIMMPPGESLEGVVTSQHTGEYLCREIKRLYPGLPIFCVSVVNNVDVMNRIKSYGARFIKKGETPLNTVLNLIKSKLTGVAFSTDPSDRSIR